MRLNLNVALIVALYVLGCGAFPAFSQDADPRGGKPPRAQVRPAAEPSPAEPVIDGVGNATIPQEAAEDSGSRPLDGTPAPASDGAENMPAEADKALAIAPAADGPAAGGGAQPGSDSPAQPQAAQCQRTVVANVVALDQSFFYNRYGAFNPGGMIYALRRDVVSTGHAEGTPQDLNSLQEGHVRLRRGKRARPLVLRVNVGDCLRINFQNLLAPAPKCRPRRRGCDQPATRTASSHVQGMQLVNSIRDDGSNVGENPSSLVPPGGRATYTYYAEREGSHLIYSTAAMTGGQGNGGSLAFGLFGSVNVEPRSAEWYRSQVTAQELEWATYNANRLPAGATLNCDNPPQCTLTTTVGGQPKQVKVLRQADGALQTLDNHPLIDYNAVYPDKAPRVGTPILNMLHNGEIVHADLNAIITGPGAGRFPRGTYPAVKVSPDREQPFREFTTIYHDEIKAVQAFPQLEDEGRNPNPPLAHTLHSVRDAFAINYGTGGIGAEILANRVGLGPVRQCDECLFEEFFLSSWAVADPAMIVDRPVSLQIDARGKPIPGAAPASKAFYPDDPSNVHHSYLNDHVKFRVMHAGPKEHHIHHLHAHQWLHTPDSDTSTMLDSQAIGPGSSFTTEIVHGGAGNRSKTPGDAIFHCHFYPHFAQGMWELMRVHDVFEAGTRLDRNGRPASGSRALPDGEIMAGTPIPALVPLPTLAMAPMPGARAEIVNGQIRVTGTGNPGYPFFVAAMAGHRPPQPPDDFACDCETDAGGACLKDNQGLTVCKRDANGVVYLDGGLPRHRIRSAEVAYHKEHLPQFDLGKARLDFDKSLIRAIAEEVPREGTREEQAAMRFHRQLKHNSFKPDGQPTLFITNGLEPKQGAPFSDPCRKDNGATDPNDLQVIPVGGGKLREYRAAIFQTDVIFNKAGWHFPQQRISTLWADVLPTIRRRRAPEPLFFRVNSNDCVLHYLTNLVPRVYAQDDFQVRTPTDTMGQHIHLVKFDVTSSDGGANGFNYEDGAFAPEEVRERVEAINLGGGLLPFGQSTGGRPLEAKLHSFSDFARPEWRGAQTTIQRWFADDVLDNQNNDRTQRTAFTHDHFGPSTHQQVGQYAGAAIEPEGSKWRNPFTGDVFGGEGIRPPRFDGGPTSWRADIITADPAQSYREFLIEFSDFQHAYRAGGGGTAEKPVADPAAVINPPAKEAAGLPLLLRKMQRCPGTNIAPPCPEAIAAADVGTMVINYRNEPIPHRIWNFEGVGPEPGPGQFPQQAGGDEGDLANVYRSDIPRVDQRYNVQPDFYPPLSNTPASNPNNPFSPQQRDPFTPLLTAYEDDLVQIRILVGAHEEGHNFTINGVKWLMEPSFLDSGYRNSQMMGISEHYEFVVQQPVPDNKLREAFEGYMTFDFRYAPGAAVDDQWNGLWGIVRTVRNLSGGKPAEGHLLPLPGNEDGRATRQPTSDAEFSRQAERVRVCPPDLREEDRISYHVTAALARDALPEGTLVYNPRLNHKGGRLHDPTAIIYFRTDDLDDKGKLRPGFQVEPLILRARAGQCINVTLRNNIREVVDRDGFNTLPMIIDNFNANQIRPSGQVGLHPQLVFYNIRNGDGMNVGLNPQQFGPQTARFGEEVTYQWYAGGVITATELRRLERLRSRFLAEGRAGQDRSELWEHRPFEFGATNLMPADPIKHSNKGAIGALIIEPKGATWSKPDYEFVQDSRRPPGHLVRTREQLTITTPDGGRFRDFVLLFQNDINLRFHGGAAVPNTAEAEDAEDSGQKAFNYRTEPIWKRMFFWPDTPLNGRNRGWCNPTRRCIFTNALSNLQTGGGAFPDPVVDPVTPVFTAAPGQYARFRVLHPGGHARNNSFVLHGHTWQELPYTTGQDSTEIGDNLLSEWKSAQAGHGPSNHFDVDLRIGSGGRFRVAGDYLYRDQASFTFDGGMWGVFRVRAPGARSGGTAVLGDVTTQPTPRGSAGRRVRRGRTQTTRRRPRT